MVHFIKIYGRRRKSTPEILSAIRIKIEYSFLVFEIDRRIIPLGTSCFSNINFPKNLIVHFEKQNITQCCWFEHSVKILYVFNGTYIAQCCTLEPIYQLGIYI